MFTQPFCSVTHSGRFTLIHCGDSTQRSVDPAEFKRSFLPVDCTLREVKTWLIFKSWASWLVLKKEMSGHYRLQFLPGKNEYMKPWLPTRQATEERHLQNNSFLLLFYWSDQMHSPSPPPPLLLQVPGPVMSGSLPNHIRARSKLQEQKGEQENLISHRVRIKPPPTSQDHRHQATSHRPHRGFSWVVGGGQAAEPVVIWKTEYRGQIHAPCAG